MKKFLSIIVVFTALMMFAKTAQAELNLSVSLGSPYRSGCDYPSSYGRVYSRPVVYYSEAPRYYRPRRRVVHYYDAPSYYSGRRYYSNHRHYRHNRW